MRADDGCAAVRASRAPQRCDCLMGETKGRADDESERKNEKRNENWIECDEDHKAMEHARAFKQCNKCKNLWVLSLCLTHAHTHSQRSNSISLRLFVWTKHSTHKKKIIIISLWCALASLLTQWAKEIFIRHLIRENNGKTKAAMNFENKNPTHWLSDWLSDSDSCWYALIMKMLHMFVPRTECTISFASQSDSAIGAQPDGGISTRVPRLTANIIYITS